MVAVLKKQASPRPSAALRAEVVRLEKLIRQGERTENALKTSMPALLAQDDEDAIRQAQQSLVDVRHERPRLAEQLEQVRAALELALAREAQVAHAQTYKVLSAAIGATVADVSEVQDCIVKLAESWAKATTGIDALEAKLRYHGITTDPYLLRATIKGVTQLCLHVETEGLFGKANTIESFDQLRSNGRASLKRLAETFETLTLRQVQTVLHLTSQE